MEKKTKLTESQLRNYIYEKVKNVLKEQRSFEEEMLDYERAYMPKSIPGLLEKVGIELGNKRCNEILKELEEMTGWSHKITKEPEEQMFGYCIIDEPGGRVLADYQPDFGSNQVRWEIINDMCELIIKGK